VTVLPFYQGSTPPTLPIVFDSAANSSAIDDSPSVISWSHTVGTGSNGILIVGVTTGEQIPDQPAQPTSVTYNSVPLTFLTGEFDPSSYVRSEIWYLLNPPTGAASVVVTYPSDNPPMWAIGGSVSYFNVASVGASDVANGSVGPATVTVTVANPGDLVVDTLGSIQWPPDPTPGSSQTQRWNVVASGAYQGYFPVPPDFVGGGSDQVASSSSVTMTWSPITAVSGTPPYTTTTAVDWAEVAVDLVAFGQDPAPSVTTTFTSSTHQFSLAIRKSSFPTSRWVLGCSGMIPKSLAPKKVIVSVGSKYVGVVDCRSPWDVSFGGNLKPTTNWIQIIWPSGMITVACQG
jgi:hypothetical protein